MHCNVHSSALFGTHVYFFPFLKSLLCNFSSLFMEKEIKMNPLPYRIKKFCVKSTILSPSPLGCNPSSKQQPREPSGTCLSPFPYLLSSLSSRVLSSLTDQLVVPGMNKFFCEAFVRTILIGMLFPQVSSGLAHPSLKVSAQRSLGQRRLFRHFH